MNKSSKNSPLLYIEVHLQFMIMVGETPLVVI